MPVDDGEVARFVFHDDGLTPVGVGEDRLHRARHRREHIVTNVGIDIETCVLLDEAAAAADPVVAEGARDCPAREAPLKRPQKRDSLGDELHIVEIDEAGDVALHREAAHGVAVRVQIREWDDGSIPGVARRHVDVVGERQPVRDDLVIAPRREREGEILFLDGAAASHPHRECVHAAGVELAVPVQVDVAVGFVVDLEAVVTVLLGRVVEVLVEGELSVKNERLLAIAVEGVVVVTSILALVDGDRHVA